MATSNELIAIRLVALERAKGELNAALQCYWGTEDQQEWEEINKIERELSEFLANR